jgi:Antibiotic biosynthesis monooxygenase
MWAQLISMRVKDDSGDDLSRLLAHLRDIEQPDSGWMRTIALRERADPNRVLVLAIFESEEKARARESDPRRAEGLATLRVMMGNLLDTPPQFSDLLVVDDSGS